MAYIVAVCPAREPRVHVAWHFGAGDARNGGGVFRWGATLEEARARGLLWAVIAAHRAEPRLAAVRTVGTLRGHAANRDLARILPDVLVERCQHDDPGFLAVVELAMAL